MCQTGIVGALYEKMYTVQSRQVHHLDVGQLTNEITNDLRRASFVSKSQMRTVVMPVIVVSLLLLLFSQFGWASLVGLAIIVLNFLILLKMSSVLAQINSKKLDSTDLRNKELAMGLQGIKTIKFNCWERLLLDKVDRHRQTEQKCVFRQTLLRISMEIVGFVMPCLAALATIVAFNSSSGSVALGDVFFVISIFHIIVSPMKQFGDGYSRLVQAKMSFRRLEKIIRLPDEQDEPVSQPTRTRRGEIRLSNWTIGLGSADGRSFQTVLENLNLKVNRGDLVVVHGPVSSGKSMFLQALIDNLETLSGSKSLTGSVSYLPQTSFLMSDSIRNNILFGQEMDFVKYQRCLRLCSLEDDLKQIKGGDSAPIRENGANLSGGQKQRISLARALYQDSDILLCDDVLSAIDNQLSTRIFLDAIHGHLKQEHKTVILCSSDLSLLKYADVAIEIKNRSFVVEYKTLVKNLETRSLDLNATANDDCLGSDDRRGSIGSFLNWDSSSCAHQNWILELRSALTDLTEAHSVEHKSEALTKSTKAGSTCTSISSLGQVDSPVFNSASSVHSNSLLTSIMKYFGMESFFKLALLVATTFALIFLKLGLDYFIGLWVMFDSKGVYLIACIFLMVLLFAVGISRAVQISTYFTSISNKLFHDLMVRILGKSLRFFNRTPIGRLLNLTSKDIDTVDLIYPQQMAIILFCGSQLTVICFSVSLHCLPILLLVALLFFCLFCCIRLYIPVSQDLKRAESASYSPLISRIIEVYNGILVFRHSEAVPRQRHIFGQLVDRTATLFMSQARVTVFTQFICELTTSMFILVVFGVLTALSLGRDSMPKSELTLLSANLNWIFVIPSFINLLLIYYSFFCQSMISAERIFNLVPTEDSDVDWFGHQPQTIQLGGRISIKNTSLRYTPQSPPALKNITLEIRPGQRVGVVGQTGSGKSSLLLALSRMIPIESCAPFSQPQSQSSSGNSSADSQVKAWPASGEVLLDGIDFTKFRERDLRHSFGIINQESFVFEGTLKDNMDPLGQYSYSELIKLVFSLGILGSDSVERVLGRRVDVQDPVNDLSKAEIVQIMEMRIKEHGKNISQGQKQLICMSRLVLKKPQVVLIDEATANVDCQSDQRIQELIANTLPQSTVISITHRVQSLGDYDQVVVLDKGRIVEKGSPQELSERKQYFWGLINAKKIKNF